MLEESLDLPVSDDISWQDFTQLSKVKDLLLLNPSMTLLDVTPDGMPSWYTDEQLLTLTLTNMGQRKTRGSKGEPVYEDLDQDELEDEA
jgi:hypothetical protein